MYLYFSNHQKICVGMNSGGHVRAAACASCGYPCYMVKKIIRNKSVIYLNNKPYLF